MKNSDGSVTVSFKMAFGRGPRGQKRAADPSPESNPASPSGTQIVAPPTPDPSGIPKITQMLVLGHWFERLVHDGVVKDYAEIARRTGLSRARVTQIVNLTLLAPEVQEAMLLGVVGNPLCSTEGRLRSLVHPAYWDGPRPEI